MAFTAKVREWWAPFRCDGANFTKVNFLGTYPVTTQVRLVPAVEAMEQALRLTGYPEPAWPTGSYNCRKIAGTDAYSLHAFAIALDVDYDANPHLRQRIRPGFGTDPRFRITEEQVRAVEAIRNIQGEQMWRWLGWAIGDTMHFQINVPPSRVTVDPSTVGGDMKDRLFLLWAKEIQLLTASDDIDWWMSGAPSEADFAHLIETMGRRFRGLYGGTQLPDSFDAHIQIQP